MLEKSKAHAAALHACDPSRPQQRQDPLPENLENVLGRGWGSPSPPRLHTGNRQKQYGSIKARVPRAGLLEGLKCTGSHH